MKQKIFSLIFGALAGLVLFFLVSSLLGTNVASSISKFKTNQTTSSNRSKRNNLGAINLLNGKSGSMFNGSGKIGNLSGNKFNTGYSNKLNSGTINLSGSKPLGIKRGNRSSLVEQTTE